VEATDFRGVALRRRLQAGGSDRRQEAGRLVRVRDRVTTPIPAIRFVAALALGLAAASCVVAAEEAAEPSESREELVREFNDPLTAVPQIFVQDAYSPSMFGTEAQSNRVIARLLVPRVPRFSLFPFVQLIRPSMSLVTVPTGRGRGTRTELGDMQLFDLAVLPWPKRETGIYMGVGPVFVFPTATHETAGQGAWQAGPAFGAIYKGIPGLLLGILVQNPISFEYTSQDRRPVSTLLVQPIVVKHIWHGLYVKSADATWSFGWYEGSPTTIPLSLGLGWVIPREGSPPLNLFVSGEWMAHRENAPVASQVMVRFGLTVAIPGLSPW
jgi:hypothetical protein